MVLAWVVWCELLVLYILRHLYILAEPLPGNLLIHSHTHPSALQPAWPLGQWIALESIVVLLTHLSITMLDSSTAL